MKHAIDGLVCTFVRLLQDAVDILNTDGGHILIFLLLIWRSTVNPTLEKHSELIIGGLLLILKQAGSNKTRRDRPTPTTETSTATVETTAATEKPKE